MLLPIREFYPLLFIIVKYLNSQKRCFVLLKERVCERVCERVVGYFGVWAGGSR